MRLARRVLYARGARAGALEPGALEPGGREAPLRYVLRPPIAQERLRQLPDGTVRVSASV